MKYVGRWNNGSGYMEWGGTPTDTVEKAKAQVDGIGWSDVDVVEVKATAVIRDGQVASPAVEGDVIAIKTGQGWQKQNENN